MSLPLGLFPEPWYIERQDLCTSAHKISCVSKCIKHIGLEGQRPKNIKVRQGACRLCAQNVEQPLCRRSSSIAA